ncbi:hypothetical protein [Planomonospora venezuelensis]|uniref:Uncharacterized protein n=1 Tax=Planomonospora venezuelensis TaxID=1999 RepID=A0A841CX49_PLAVE|nr:hypothetical protein [Planomonospora venezuelensis]MBB5961879.1 hypothetical protein [Planomonospora venezuelensis]GIM99179.1 hypothetical protein Pve01_08380 [Planomonospora venezuelensis]
MTTQATPQPAQESAGEPEAGRITKARRWIVTAVAGALATLISTVILGAWPRLLDQWADFRGRPHLIATAYAVEVDSGDEVAFERPVPLGPGGTLLPPGSRRQDVLALIKRENAARVRGVTVNIILRNARHETIRILDVRPRILQDAPLWSGACMDFPTQGEATVYEVAADLDNLRPGKEGRKGGFLKKNIDLADGERASIELSATAKKRYYLWDVQVDYLYGDSPEVRHEYIKDSGGAAFRLTGKAKKYKEYYTATVYSNDYRRVRRSKPC